MLNTQGMSLMMLQIFSTLLSPLPFFAIKSHMSPYPLLHPNPDCHMSRYITHKQILVFQKKKALQYRSYFNFDFKI